jgi:hypothetical protein
MNRIATIVALTLIASTAVARDDRETSGGTSANSNATAVTGSAAQSQQGQAQDASNTQGQSVNFNSPLLPQQPTETTQNVRYSGTQTVKNVPGVVISGPASGPCNGFSAGMGASIPGFGIGANMSKVDEGCEERETARIAALMGRMDLANLVIENTAVVQRALARKQEREAQKRAEVATPATVTVSGQCDPFIKARTGECKI